MSEAFSRSELVLGSKSTEILAGKTVAVFGLGGVGSFAVEGLVRSGIGHLVLVDHDIISQSNLNRQLYALNSTIGMKKTDVALSRIKDNNPKAEVSLYSCFFDASTMSQFDFSSYDYVVDCIDTISSKILLVEQCIKFQTPLICSMGTGNKTNPSRLEFADISRTSICPLARVMRQELRKRGILHQMVLYSKEEPIKAFVEEKEGKRCSTPGSVAFVPSVAGLLISGYVVKALL